MKDSILELVTLFGILLAPLGGNAMTDYPHNQDFDDAKKILYKIYNHPKVLKKTYYCSCEFKSKKNIDFSSCGYKGKLKKNGEEYYKNRKFRTEAEHKFPVSKAKGAFSECRVAGSKKTLSRSKCLKVSSGFRALEGDLFNLDPALGSLNGIRSNLSYAEISGEKREWGKCDFEKIGRKVEPPQNKKGDIARVYFYLNDRWPSVGIISKKNRKLFEAWDKLDPVDEQEIIISCLKAKYQGNVNPYVSDCKNFKY